ncbi:MULTISPECIES: Hsp33 family molecular chaperone HslO [unclassified Butyrivibrio]|uniref:Hsp33 family molecular chaperone HslO n=1 Tax=unclassified Butyrivibrio TaxID=2639466 RepID=UPI0003B4B2E8|nr:MULTISPECIES: Hsp33 family molecular chaperone HslO [unclassified Butyrivibrio]
MEYKDYMVRATAADAQIRAFAITSRNLVDEARKIHDLTPICSAALGRLMSGALMMGDMLKNEKDALTITVDGDGPIGGLLATVNNRGEVKGYVKNNTVVLPNNDAGHLNVGGAVGNGTLTVTRDLGLKDPYVGTIQLLSGEIADDLTCYFVESEQIPSSVGLGVLVNKDFSIMEAGGFIVQLMPGASEEVISKLEGNIQGMKTVTEILKEGNTPEDMLNMVLAGFDIDITATMPVKYHCGCDRDRVERALTLLGKKELEDLASDGEDVEIKCHFCGKAYSFTPADLKEMMVKAK